MMNQRQTVVNVSECSEDHPDGEQLYRYDVEEDATISIATVYRSVKLHQLADVIDRLEFEVGRTGYQEAGELHENLIDVENGEAIKF